MHIRTKKWARPELSACPFYEPDGEEWKGRWRERFRNPSLPLHVEMGCGKGVSTAKMVAANPEINFVAVDISPDVLGDARRNIVRECGEKPGNVWLLRADISLIQRYFGIGDQVERIYISFCNPWTERPKHEKRRLTHPRQLAQYREMMSKGAEIWFKTDDETLFLDSLVYFDLCGFECRYITHDLERSGFQPNYVSEHEMMYMEKKVPIRGAIFRKAEWNDPFDPVRFRLTPGVKREGLKKFGIVV